MHPEMVDFCFNYISVSVSVVDMNGHMEKFLVPNVNIYISKRESTTKGRMGWLKSRVHVISNL